MVKVKNINNATGSSSSNSPSTNANTTLSTATKASLLKSKDSNKLNDMKNDLLTQLNNNKDKLQNRASLSLQKQISAALRPVKLKNLQIDYLTKLEQVIEDKHKLSLSELKALKFDKSYLVNVIFYTRNNPNQVDPKTGLVAWKIKPAFLIN
jgi:uncharacterized protein YfkK (UPF0435 family)